MPAWFGNARSDIVGGLVSASVAIPLAMGFGMFAFVALGDQYFAYGVLAGLYTATIVAVVSVATGERMTTLYAPRVVTTFFLGSLVFALVHSGAPIIRAGNVSQTLAIIFSIILVGGVFQVLFGLLRMGTLILHTPHPVMAGFQNAAALLLFLVQIGNVLGYETNVRLNGLAAHVSSAKPLSIAVAGFSMLVMWHMRRITTVVPPLVAGLLAGTAAYHALALGGWSDLLGPVIGPTPAAKVTAAWNVPAFVALAEQPSFWEIAPSIVAGGLGLAIIASIDALLCAQLLSRPGERRPSVDRQLVRLGLGNVAAASLGGITSGVNLGPSLVNRAYGARTSLSVLVNAGAVLATTLLLMPALAYLPRAVLSAVIMVVAIQHVDLSTMQLGKGLLGGRVANRASLGLDLLVIVLVATLSIMFNIVLAVFVGVGLAVVLFTLRMSRALIRRSCRGDAMPSRRTRNAPELAILATHGRQIHALELEGAIFFGSVDRLVSAIEATMEDGARFVILDFGHVTDVDMTGSRLISQLHEDIAARDGHLLLANVKQQTHWGRMLRDLGVTTAPVAERMFPDLDRAIEWAEERIIASVSGEPVALHEVGFDELDILRELDPAERTRVRDMAELRHYRNGDVVFAEGDAGSEIFVVLRGSASVQLAQQGGGAIRLVSFSAGTVFGELALLNKAPRSATVLADGDLVCVVLTEAAFEALQHDHPAIAIKLITNLAREVSNSLRRATRTIQHLMS
jgi:MFS superfamily sulfate permease-like transporter